MLKNTVKNLEPYSTLKINEISRELEDKGEKIFKFKKKGIITHQDQD